MVESKGTLSAVAEKKVHKSKIKSAVPGKRPKKNNLIFSRTIDNIAPHNTAPSHNANEQSEISNYQNEYIETLSDERGGRIQN